MNTVGVWYGVGGWRYFVRTVDAEGHDRYGGIAGQLPCRYDASLCELHRALALRWPEMPEAYRHDEAWTAAEYGKGWNTKT